MLGGRGTGGAVLVSGVYLGSKCKGAQTQLLEREGAEGLGSCRCEREALWGGSRAVGCREISDENSTGRGEGFLLEGGAREGVLSSWLHC